MERLALLKALGDNTRYAIYLEIARSSSPRSTSDIAEILGLHPNTVRPHLERMRDVGLLDVEVDARGAVGRPQHRYALSPEAPSLGLEPPAYPTLARMLAQVAARTGPESDDVLEAGRSQGRATGRSAALAAKNAGTSAIVGTSGGDADPIDRCFAALVRQMAVLGFDPVGDGAPDEGVTVAFTHCPYRELAEAHPDLVCHLHRGMIEGFVEGFAHDLNGDNPDATDPAAPDPAAARLAVDEFHTLADRDPCQVSLSSRYAEETP